MEVVGKRHYGLKALPPGGGGGQRITRELFDTLLLWKATVPLDAAGNASIDVPLNDSLTSFRIVAVASGGIGMFGTGDTLIQSTQDLMILPGVSPIIRTGDSFDAEFTVRNASEHAFTAAVNAKIEGLKEQPAPQTLELAAGQGKSIDWKVTVPIGVSELRYRVDAAVAGGRPVGSSGDNAARAAGGPGQNLAGDADAIGKADRRAGSVARRRAQRPGRRAGLAQPFAQRRP